MVEENITNGGGAVECQIRRRTEGHAIVYPGHVVLIELYPHVGRLVRARVLLVGEYWE